MATNLVNIPIEENFKTQLSRELIADSGALSLYVDSVPVGTIPSGQKIRVTINSRQGFDEMEEVLVESIDTSNNILVIATGGRAQARYNGDSPSPLLHNIGDEVIISNPYGLWKEAQDAINSKVDKGGDEMDGPLKVATYANETARDTAIPSPEDGQEVYLTAEGRFEDRVSGAWVQRASGAVSNASETVAGKIELSTNAEQATQQSTGGTGARLVMPLDQFVQEQEIYTPGYLTGGTSAQSNAGTWAAVTDGSFRVTVDGVTYNVDGIDFTGDLSMSDVATTIQTALRAATSGTETVVWSTDHFVITSGDTSSTSAVSLLETSTGTVGTDISGAGASDWMDADSGNGTVTAAVLNRAANANKGLLLDIRGYIANLFIDESYFQPTSTLTAKGDLYVATFDAAFLTGGTNVETTPATWAAVSDGSFRITIDGTGYNVDAIDFSGDSSMDEVAATIQAALRSATGGLETVVWDTDHLVITSGTYGTSSSITVTSTSTGTVGTDISGAGASDWMDCDTGNGTVTAVEQTIDRLAMGETGQVLISDESEDKGLKYANLYGIGNFGRAEGRYTAPVPADAWNDGDIVTQAGYTVIFDNTAAEKRATVDIHFYVFPQLENLTIEEIVMDYVIEYAQTGSADVDRWWGLSENSSTGFAGGGDAIGFYLDGSEGKLYAFNRLTSATTTEIADVTTNTPYHVRFEADGSEIRFYLNNVLVATHTTNLPDLDACGQYVAMTETEVGSVATNYRSQISAIFLSYKAS